MPRHVSRRTRAVQRALLALVTAGAALGAATAAAHATPLAEAPSRAAVPARGDGGVLSDFTGPLVQAEALGAVPALEGAGGFLTGQS